MIEDAKVQKQFDRTEPKHIEYVICTSPRTGASWLWSMMEAAGLGTCREFLEYEDQWIKDYADCTGLKVVWAAKKRLESQLDLNKVKLIYVTRRDRLRQAISLYRSIETARWSCFDKSELPDPPFRADRIWEALKWLNEYERSWLRWLRGRPHLALYYEELSKDTVYQVANFLGKELAQPPTDGYFTIQRDAWTEDCYNYLLEEVVAELGDEMTWRSWGNARESAKKAIK